MLTFHLEGRRGVLFTTDDGDGADNNVSSYKNVLSKSKHKVCPTLLGASASGLFNLYALLSGVYECKLIQQSTVSSKNLARTVESTSSSNFSLQYIIRYSP